MNFNVKRLISKSVDTPTDTNSATEKVKKYQQLCFELREKRQVYKVKVTASNHKMLWWRIERIKGRPTRTIR